MTTAPIESPIGDRATYYPMTPAESIALPQLSKNAYRLLMLIKAAAPFGNKVMFTDELNPKTLQQALGVHRATFWRAKRQLLQHKLVEFNDHYIRDCHTVDRGQFKKASAEAAPESQFSELPIFQWFRSAIEVARSQPLLQNCNAQPLQPSSINGSGARKDLKSASSKTSNQSTTDSTVVSPNGFAPEPERSLDLPASPPPAKKPQRHAKTPQTRRLIPGQFSVFEEKLKAIGVTLNPTLLREFYRAGFERVKLAIEYVARRVEAGIERPIEKIERYLFHIVRHGENLTAAPTAGQATEKQVFAQWFDASRNLGQALYSIQQGDEIMVSLSNGDYLPWKIAMERYPAGQISL